MKLWWSGVGVCSSLNPSTPSRDTVLKRSSIPRVLCSWMGPSFVDLWNAVRTEVLISEILRAFRCIDDHTGTVRITMVAPYLAAAASIVVEELALMERGQSFE